MERNRKRRRTVRIYKIALALIVLAALGAFWYIRFAPNNKVMDPAEYFNGLLAEQGASPLSEEGELAVVMQDHVDGRRAYLEGGELYLDYDLVREQLNSRFYWDNQKGILLYTTALETWEIPVNSASYTVDGEQKKYSHEILHSDARGKFMNAAFVQEYTNVAYRVEEETKHVLIDYKWGERLGATVKKDTAVRAGVGIKNMVLTKVPADDTVYILETQEKWTKVVTADGFIGYIQNKRITEGEQKEFTRDFTPQAYPSLTQEEKVTLIWHRIDNPDSNNYVLQDTKQVTGVNVISPTWFSLTDEQGNISSLASKKYVRIAHHRGMKVWGLVSNFEEGVSTTAMLTSTDARRNFTANLIEEALACGMDGINLDLEAITEDGGYSYVQLVRELSIACRKNSLVLSVDVPVPMSWNGYYDRQELGTVADYVIIMGYDEHYVGSEAGSVASIGFEENGIQETLKLVEPGKIISGVPFYSRLWYMYDAGDGTLAVDYSEAYGMSSVTKILEDNGVSAQWDEETAQNYATWVNEEDGLTRQIWIEDEESIARKAALVKQYELGGIAAWALGFERNAVWDVIAEQIS